MIHIRLNLNIFVTFSLLKYVCYRKYKPNRKEQNVIKAKKKLNIGALQFEDCNCLYFEMCTFNLYSYEIYLNKNGIVMYILLKPAFQ